MRRSILNVFVGAVLLTAAASGAYWSLSESGLLDFGSFVLAGQAYEQGLDPYGVHEGLADASGLDLGFDDRPYSPNLNPPVSVYPFTLLVGHSQASRFGLRVVSAVVYLGACLALLRAYPWQRRGLVVLWMAAMAGFWYTLWLGQIYVLLFAIGLGAWLLLEKDSRPLLAGLLIGLTVAIKPNFAIWPLLLLLAGHPKPVLVATLTALAVSAIPLAIDGPSIYTQWLDAARGYDRVVIAANGSLVGTASRLGITPAGYALATAVILAAVAGTWRSRPSQRNASAVAIAVTLVVGPLGWLGYTLFALPLLMSRLWRGWEVAVAGSLVLPADLIPLSGEVHLAGILLLLGLLVGDALRSRRAAAAIAPSLPAVDAVAPARQAA